MQLDSSTNIVRELDEQLSTLKKKMQDIQETLQKVEDQLSAIIHES